MTKPAETIGAAEAEVLLGVDRDTIHRLKRQGRLVPVHKLPGRTGSYLFSRAEVVALAAERRAELEAQIARIGAA